ncbi:hypothetical protein [Gilliamella sp. N-W3]|uniref:hypothetical protein n=1 Tax=Gilliamella sp. N-W3 TaxID=1970474 RepID=UPI000A353F06|nr:hypothetical protein [Gilliamella sp. N-W3]
MPVKIDSFKSIQTYVPLLSTGNSQYPNIDINSLIASPYNYWGDDDGDDKVTATGTLNIKWEDSFKTDITKKVGLNPNSQLNPCRSPYKLTISVTGGQLSTLYGLPNSSEFVGGSHIYYFTPHSESIYACYAQPNLVFDKSTYLWSQYDIDVEGPDWVTSKGFEIQNLYQPELNFPTTGSNGLYFYLLLVGITPDEVIAANGSSITSENGSDVSVLLSLTTPTTSIWQGEFNSVGEKSVLLKVKLKGPDRLSSNKSFKPAIFKIYADKSKTKLLYSFKLQRWYIVQPNVKINSYTQAKTFCDQLGSGYRVPDVNDFTNANNEKYDWLGGIVGRLGNIAAYRRQISYRDSSNKWIGGLFNEWGCISNSYNNDPSGAFKCSGYSGIDWDTFYGYYTNSKYQGTNDGYKGSYYVVAGNVGVVEPEIVNKIRRSDRAVCVTP